MDLNTARATLTTAISHRTLTESQHEELLGDLAHARAVETEKLADAAAAFDAQEVCSVADAVQCAERRREADAIAEAATRIVVTAISAVEAHDRPLAQARRAVEIAAEAVLEAENEILVGQAERLLLELMKVGKKLHLPSEIDTPINKFHTREAKIARAVERLLATMQDDLHTPVNRLASLRGRPESDYRIRRRAALIAGTDPESDDAQAAA